MQKSNGKKTLEEHRENKGNFFPAFDYSRFIKTAVTTFIIGLICFMILFFYIAAHGK